MVATFHRTLRMHLPSPHSTGRVLPIRHRRVSVTAPVSNRDRAAAVVLAHRRLQAPAATKLSRSKRAVRLVLTAAVICGAAASSPDTPGPFLLLTVTIVMTAMFALVSTP